MEHLDYLVEQTGGRVVIEHITAPKGWERALTTSPVIQLARARILVEIFHGQWPSDN